ncbi:kinesin-like protein KIF18A isoform X2 [Prorops nasuta]|uniref:kinesin-like protein KIF18A isoform X2 n=1 Tax=Prorops nasuta TaxID=863751 RepID=UPI0034CE77FB
MVFNKSKVLSPNKVKRLNGKSKIGIKPSTSGSTTGHSDNGSQNIKVIVRVRPQNEVEIQKNSKNVIKVVDDRMLIFDPKEEESPFFYQGIAQKGRDLNKKQNKDLQFIFDRIFEPFASNSDVFNGTTKFLITSLLDGYNCSVFAYGATGAGKTHTMLGSFNDPGITYRTVAELYSQIESQSEHKDFNLGVTYLEIYNENVYDLLHKSNPLQLREDERCGVIVAGLKVITINDAEELLGLLTKGNKNRTQHPTDANQESSRSHAVFQVYIKMNNKLDGQVKQVKLSMIDLAGSERGSATGCKGARFKEGANINKSLLALGNCINKLADGVKHIPYRDSKLTRLLKDSLGGNCQTIMIANVAPTSYSYEDTYNTLKYADRAKKIKTHIKKNILSCEMHVTGYIKMVEEQKKEIALLKQKLLTFENGTIQPSETKISVTEENNKHLNDLSKKLIGILEKKQVLNERILSLESADKILCCRMQYKKTADERLKNLTAAIGEFTEEQNGSGKNRLNKSLLYFKRQRDALKIKMKTVWDDLRRVEIELQQINSEIKNESLCEKLSDKISLRACEIEKCHMQQQFEHTKKVSSLQQCEMQSLHTIIKMMSTTLQNYYNMMMGLGSMTESMKQEFKQLIKMLEGVRNIKWSDLEMTDHEDFYNLTYLSTQQLLDPIKNEMPLASVNIYDNDKNPDLTTTLDSTFHLIPDETEKCDIQNTTVTKTEKTDVLYDNNDKDENIELNSTFNLQEKAKKRPLFDQNSSSKSPAKMAKKLTKQKNGSQLLDSEKENKDVQRPTVMSAKSIAILNRIRSEKLKQIGNSEYKDECNNDHTDSGLKTVRHKERRGLMASHPYHKPNAKAN